MAVQDSKTHYSPLTLKLGSKDNSAINIDNLEDAPQELIDYVSAARVELSIDEAGIFVLNVDDVSEKASTSENGQSETEKRKLKNNQKFAVTFAATTEDGSSPTEAQSQEEFLLVGRIKTVGSSTTGQSKIPNEYVGADVAICLYEGNHTRNFPNMSYSDIVKKILQEEGLKVGQIDDSGEPKDLVTQRGQTYAEFIRSMADWIGFEFFVRSAKVYFRKPVADDTIPLKWGKNIESCTVSVDTKGQVTKINVRSWDRDKKNLVESTRLTSDCETESTIGKESEEPIDSREQDQGRERVLTVPVPGGWTLKDVETFAKVLCMDLSKQLVTATAYCKGDPRIIPGVRVDIRNNSGDNDELNGYYYVTEADHFYDDRKYTTYFEVSNCRYSSYIQSDMSGAGGSGGVGSGNRTGPMGRPSDKIGQTPIIGIVTDNDDPENLGRVKVRFPTLSDENESDWARVVSVGAGQPGKTGGQGIHWLPEIEDEVLVAFTDGDIDCPYVLGGLWSSEDKPPVESGEALQGEKVNVRTFRTPKGNLVQFVEEDGSKKQGIYIETANGHKIHLNDTEKNLTITSPKVITLDAPLIIANGKLVPKETCL